MPARLLEGAPVAEAVLADVRTRVEKLAADGVTVGLGTILATDDDASAGYVRIKHQRCEELGITSVHEQLGPDATHDDLVAAIRRFNEDERVHAFLVQNPVYPHMDFNEAMVAMDPDKDVDGLHPVNLGRLVLQAPGPRPCTPAGIQAMLLHYGIDISGKDVVVVGRGPTLGRPLALLLTLKAPGANAAVTVVHTGVPDIADYTRRGDVVVVAVGVPGFLTPDMVKPGVVVVGGGVTYEGRRVISDVDEACAEVAAWVTPRLGGVGPTTVAMLMRNVVEAAERRHAG